MTALEITRRPGTHLSSVIDALRELRMWDSPPLAPHVEARVQIAVQYSAFIDKEHKEASRHRAAEDQVVPTGIDFSRVNGMRVEAAQRLAERPPATVAQARRTAGVTPSDIGALLVHLRRLQMSTPPPASGT